MIQVVLVIWYAEKEFEAVSGCIDVLDRPKDDTAVTVCQYFAKPDVMRFLREAQCGTSIVTSDARTTALKCKGEIKKLIR